MVKLGASNCRINTHKDNTDLSASPRALPEKLSVGKRACMNPRLLKNQKLGVCSTLRNHNPLLSVWVPNSNPSHKLQTASF